MELYYGMGNESKSIRVAANSVFISEGGIISFEHFQ